MRKNDSFQRSRRRTKKPRLRLFPIIRRTIGRTALRLQNSRIRWARVAPATLCLLLMLSGLVRLTGYGIAAVRHRRSSARLAAEYAQLTESAAKTAVSDAPYTEAPSAAEAPLLLPVSDRPFLPANAASGAGHSVASMADMPAQFWQTGGEVLSAMRPFVKQNPDTVGWLQISGVVSLPVVYRDNAYYLTHDFDQKKSTAGALFLDENHPIRAQNQYLVIHGHNMHDGSMFAAIPHYRKLRFIWEHGIASFSTRYRQNDYVLFAVASVSVTPETDGFLAYTGTPFFRTEAHFDAFIRQIRAHSLYDIPVDVSPQDAVLALSTCESDRRTVVFFRRIREGEDRSELLRKLKFAK